MTESPLDAYVPLILLLMLIAEVQGAASLGTWLVVLGLSGLLLWKGLTAG